MVTSRREVCVNVDKKVCNGKTSSSLRRQNVTVRSTMFCSVFFFGFGFFLFRINVPLATNQSNKNRKKWTRNEQERSTTVNSTKPTLALAFHSRRKLYCSRQNTRLTVTYLSGRRIVSSVQHISGIFTVMLCVCTRQWEKGFICFEI